MEIPTEQPSNRKKSDRSAGILMHITSLPGPAYIGDIGPAAIKFADFLARCGQSVWQMLPVQPATAQNGYSPYSPFSAMAANPMLISPEWLIDMNLLADSDIVNIHSNKTRVDYDAATQYKEKLLDKAWSTWQSSKSSDKTAFEGYCIEQHAWLHDYALYVVLKNEYDQKPWYEWPDEFRDRHQDALTAFAEKFEDKIRKVKWIQMVFHEQWQRLRSYCTSLGIRLLGDVPIYVAHDSVDVWTHRDMFTLDDKGKMSEMAGVPPDLFNSEGQLWGMPLFRWDVLKERKFQWWIERLRKNLEYFDMLRLDHFRGFASYWSVPANAETAKSGEWLKGPGTEFFDAVNNALGKVELIAEDLGEIDDAVYELRDNLQLPGMNVLQFAFGDDMPQSVYLPHNHLKNSVVYTGTHDNNTTVGWYKELSATERKNINEYLGMDVNAANVSDQLCRLAYSSVARLAMLPMQDVLSLDETTRMNMPATADGNWVWRLDDSLLTDVLEEKLRRWVFYFDRGSHLT